MSMDTNVDNYSTDDLLTILDLDDEPTEQDIIRNSNQLIDKYNKADNEDLGNFFIDVQNTLLDEFFPDSIPPKNEQNPPIQQSWYQNEQAPQPDAQQEDKTTDRKQQVGFINTPSSSVMNRQQLGVNNDFQVPVAQGTLNPNLKNTTTRTVMINSSYRQTILPYTNNPNGPDSSTNFTCNLTDNLNDVIEIQLYSIHLPLNWYVIDENNGTNCFLIDIIDTVSGTSDSIHIYVPSGNYTIGDLMAKINIEITAATTTPSISGLTIQSDPNNGKVYFTYPTGSPTNILTLTFYDETKNICLSSDDKPCPKSMMRNSNLGWFLGFREESYKLDSPSPLYAEAIYDLYGTRNIYLVLDDYNQNRLNKGLVSISQNESALSIPSYFSNDLNCSVGDDPNQPVQYVRDAPRRVTQAQLYTINEIIRNRDNRTKTRNHAPTTTDIFAVIPIEREEGKYFGTSFVEYGGSLSQNQRTYFGPVNIDRFGVRLVDDNGNTLNLNGSDWSFSITVESLYQY
jgi:hypothetical protein